MQQCRVFHPFLVCILLEGALTISSLFIDKPRNQFSHQTNRIWVCANAECWPIKRANALWAFHACLQRQYLWKSAHDDVQPSAVRAWLYYTQTRSFPRMDLSTSQIQTVTFCYFHNLPIRYVFCDWLWNFFPYSSLPISACVSCFDKLILSSNVIRFPGGIYFFIHFFSTSSLCLYFFSLIFAFVWIQNYKFIQSPSLSPTTMICRLNHIFLATTIFCSCCCCCRFNVLCVGRAVAK